MLHREHLKVQLDGFSRLLRHTARIRKLPLILWRETSAQHFDHGIGGCYPPAPWNHLYRNIDPHNFTCTAVSYDEMVAGNWRNRMVDEAGFGDENWQFKIPSLRVWNVTAMASDLHPRVLGDRKESQAGMIADCTHFCPSFGGMYEVWSTLLHNFLRAAQPLTETLRPRLILK